MSQDPSSIEREQSTPQARPGRAGSAPWQRPAFEVISLACEISAYAPAEGDPLF
jgi:hypothetical protein